MIDLSEYKIKVCWYICKTPSETNKLFTANTLYPMTDETMLNKNCVKTNVHKILTNTNHWYEFSDTSLDGLKDEINIFGGNHLEKFIEEEIIGKEENHMIEYNELW